jgi:hypothetical protein
VNYDYLAKIRGAVTLYTKHKTSNILEGGFRSLYRGRSLEFDDLKEYDFGDNVHDIDWKSSSRSGKILIRRYVAEKKHNVLFVCDSGAKMDADTSAGSSKTELALMIFGMTAFLADRQGSDFSIAYSCARGLQLNYFRSGPEHLENLLYDYRKHMTEESGMGIDEVFKRTLNAIHKRMIIFAVTDVSGLARMDEALIRRITYENDLMVYSIEDAPLIAPDTYDTGIRRYFRPFFLKSPVLADLEKAEKQKVISAARGIFKKYRVTMTILNREDQILDRTVELFERYRNGFYG